MSRRLPLHQSCRALKWVGRGIGIATALYAAYVGVTWLRYGHPAAARSGDGDALLDRVMPVYDVVERHHIRVAAPAAVTLAAACEMDLQRSAVVRAIFRARELILGSKPDTTARPSELLPLMKSLGWACSRSCRAVKWSWAQ